MIFLFSFSYAPSLWFLLGNYRQIIWMLLNLSEWKVHLFHACGQISTLIFILKYTGNSPSSSIVSNVAHAYSSFLTVASGRSWTNNEKWIRHSHMPSRSDPANTSMFNFKCVSSIPELRERLQNQEWIKVFIALRYKNFTINLFFH